MQAEASILFTRDGYILQAAVSPRLETELPNEEFISIARFAAFLLISGESRMTNTKVRRYYAVISSIGHIGCIVLYLRPLTADALQYALVQAVLILSVVHCYSGSEILSISEYIEYFNSQCEQGVTAIQHQGAPQSVDPSDIDTTTAIQGTSSSLRRFYTSQLIYKKIRKHFCHEHLDYFTRLSFLLFLVQPYSAHNLLCLRGIYDKELSVLNSAMCLGLVYVALPYSLSRQGCILRVTGEKLKWTLQRNPTLSNEIGYLCCLTSQYNCGIQSNVEPESTLVASSAYSCGSYQLVVQPCRFTTVSQLNDDGPMITQPISTFYLCLGALLNRDSLRNVPILENVTAISARLQFTPFETHKQLLQLANALCYPFYEEGKNIKFKTEWQAPPTSIGTIIPAQPPVFIKKAVTGTVTLNSLNITTKSDMANSGLGSGRKIRTKSHSQSNRTSVIGISDSSHSTGSNLHLMTTIDNVAHKPPQFRAPRHH